METWTTGPSSSRGVRSRRWRPSSDRSRTAVGRRAPSGLTTPAIRGGASALARAGASSVDSASDASVTDGGRQRSRRPGLTGHRPGESRHVDRSCVDRDRRRRGRVRKEDGVSGAPSRVACVPSIASAVRRAPRRRVRSARPGARPHAFVTWHQEPPGRASRPAAGRPQAPIGRPRLVVRRAPGSTTSPQAGARADRRSPAAPRRQGSRSSQDQLEIGLTASCGEVQDLRFGPAVGAGERVDVRQQPTRPGIESPATGTMRRRMACPSRARTPGIAARDGGPPGGLPRPWPRRCGPGDRPAARRRRSCPCRGARRPHSAPRGAGGRRPGSRSRR